MEINLLEIAKYAGIGIAALIILFKTFFTVSQQTAAVIERFGKFVRLARPGLNIKIPFIDAIKAVMKLNVFQLDVDVESKTKDNVFVSLKTSVQYHVLDHKVVDAYYKLIDPQKQITSYVFDLVRAEIPKLTLDEVFERKDDVANAVKKELLEIMEDFGFGIIKALITDINPDEEVKRAMNEINAAQRQRVAAEEKGEAEKILKIKQAEADATSKKLQGQGIADQRKAIVDGLKTSVDEFQKSIPGSTPSDVMSLVLMTQYFDTLKEIGSGSKTNTIFVDHSPGGMMDVKRLLAQAVGNKEDDK